MPPSHIENLWNEYLASEREGVRTVYLALLEDLLGQMERIDAQTRDEWARAIAAQVVDRGDDVPIRMPLFRRVLFPSLLAGIQSASSGCARWLAGFSQLLYNSPACLSQLPDDQRSAHGLLLVALRVDSGDRLSKARLASILRSRFEYVLHEVPWGVLYGHNGATISECGDLEGQLASFERLVGELHLEEDRELIDEARFHIRCWRDYLSRRTEYGSYENYLSQHPRPPRKMPAWTSRS